MDKFFRRIYRLMLCILTLMMIFTSFTYANEDFKKFKNLDERMAYLKSVIEYIEKNYEGEITEEELMEGAYKGVFEALDPHSNYFKPDEYEQFAIENTGVYGGIGVTISINDGKIVVTETMAGSPAQKTGLKVGDVIRSINDQDIKQYKLKQATDLLFGEPGTEVKLGIERKEQAHILNFDIVREEIKVNPVVSKILNSNIGYIKIDTFNKNTSENVEKVLKEFQNKNIKGLILDLRGNLGGLLYEAVNVADPFIPKGPVVHIDYKNKKRETLYSKKERVNMHLVVLVNELTASASEIVAGAIQDTKSGVIVGTKTYGKGTVQHTNLMINGGGIKLTIAEYLTPSERRIDGIGIQPDIVVKNTKNINRQDIKTFNNMIEDENATLGDKGLNVYGAQQRLKFLGYEKIEITGLLDGVTSNAIKEFQQLNGLAIDGILDKKTRDKLNEKVEEMYNGEEKDLQLERGIEILNDRINNEK
ncbi:S41 family peptidase [Marinisporobacter balticus]|uniref:S41A family C-terminal processing peptidase-3 n=1 Tax=Marinisporobacter balticus TaxID=2018667 RepID=A0A4R2KZU9_9FIRM|nr:S41 family peptidase [Marinisporobacter balticus]TCO78762.1 S41A family C-terminal processing peptidase-3 [Marinisporobacter balticus]